jgi:hypothetical protein
MLKHDLRSIQQAHTFDQSPEDTYLQASRTPELSRAMMFVHLTNLHHPSPEDPTPQE